MPKREPDVIHINNYSTDLPYVIIPELYYAKFLIDTGSNRSFMTPSLAYTVYPNFIQNEEFLVQSSHATSYHNETMMIQIFPTFNSEEYHKFYLFDFSENFDGLIGFDLLRQINANLDLYSQKIITPQVQIPFYIDGQSLTQNYPSNQIYPVTLENPYVIEIPPRTQQVVLLPVYQNQGTGILPYTKFIDTEMPEALVNVNDHFAITTLINANEYPVELTIFEPLDIEPVDVNEVNFIEKMETDIEYNNQIDNLHKSNLKNLRLSHCNQEEYTAIRKLCYEFRDIFHHEDIPLSFTNQIKHSIKLKNESPIFTKFYRYPEIHKPEVNSQINKMLENDVIQHSNSPWNSPIWIVPKKLDASNKKKWRVVIDYRKLNEQTVDDKYPLPNINDILDKLGKCKYFTTLDLANGFHQIEMNKDDIPKTGFSTDTGHYEI
uniref:Retrovirus-related Pol polyprotein n=1 Tax=Anoplophora glabripennis TaxID=217634 RepID=V5GL18_ANOGL